MKKPLITIAIPAYNNEKSIRKTIDSSIIQKTNTTYEILVLDDASTDGTPNILKSYGNRIRVVTLKNRVPLIENHNMCLQHAFGEYILFCHADDTLESHAISTVSSKLKERGYPSKYVLWGNSIFRDYTLQLKKSGFHKNTIINGIQASLMPMNGGLTPSGTCYSKASLLKLGGFIHVDIMTAPSDITTMLYMALNEFNFEMMDKMIFIRKDASTLTSNMKANDFLDSYDNAYKYFIKITSEKEIHKLLEISISLKKKPYYFYYALAQDKQYISHIKNNLLKHLIRKPWELKRKIVRKILNRVL